MKHLSAVGRPILNSALFVMVLAKEFTFQIIEEALLTAIDSMNWNNGECQWSTYNSSWIYKLFALKNNVSRNNSPDLPVARNIISQISIVHQYEQEKITRRIVILKKKERKTNFSHLYYWTAQRWQRQERTKVAKSLLNWPCICMNLRSGRIVPCGSSPVARLYLAKNEAPEEEAGLQSYRSRTGRFSDASWQTR